MPEIKPVPDGYTRITPYLILKGAQQAIDFYTEVFGAVEEMRMPGPEGKIGHAELRVGDSHIMLADENPEMGYSAPPPGSKIPLGLLVYVDKVDEAFKKAVDLGATVEREVVDQFYGDRTGGIVDPFGYRWYIATHIEDVSPEEMKRRMEKAKAA
jgi:PhnB protein